jgi:hypothetical protein
MYLYKKKQLQLNKIYTIGDKAISFFSIRNQVYDTMQGTSSNLQHYSLAADASIMWL